jgi:hypothetical protein
MDLDKPGAKNSFNGSIKLTSNEQLKVGEKETVGNTLSLCSYVEYQNADQSFLFIVTFLYKLRDFTNSAAIFK